MGYSDKSLSFGWSYFRKIAELQNIDLYSNDLIISVAQDTHTIMDHPYSTNATKRIGDSFCKSSNSNSKVWQSLPSAIKSKLFVSSVCNKIHTGLEVLVKRDKETGQFKNEIMAACSHPNPVTAFQLLNDILEKYGFPVYTTKQFYEAIVFGFCELTPL